MDFYIYSIISQLGIKFYTSSKYNIITVNIDCTLINQHGGGVFHDTKKENNNFTFHYQSIIKQMDSIISNHIDCFDWLI